MSVSLWRYSESCDGKPCCGDCDECGEEEMIPIKIERREPVMKWIPVSERLPEAFEHCLWTTVDGKVIEHYWDGRISEYKAWMPLPEPYKGVE